jgi:hypothetical protein
MTDTKDAPVTPAHRAAALWCLCVPRVLEEIGPKTQVWVDTGFEHNRHDPAATLVAQAIANAEARGAQSRDVTSALADYNANERMRLRLIDVATEQRRHAENARGEVKQLRAELASRDDALTEAERAVVEAAVRYETDELFGFEGLSKAVLALIALRAQKEPQP